MLFEERIRKFEYKLNDTDDQIIEYIIRNKQQVVHQSIQDLAACLFTVPNTVTRLSRKLGYDGFSHLKNSIKEELYKIEEDRTDSLRFNIQKTLQLLDMERMETAVKIMHEAKHILFFGVGDSAPFCEMMVKNLKVTGKHAAFYLHRHEILRELEQYGRNDLLFFISLSGETAQVLEIAGLAKDRGIKTLSLTHFSSNSLQKLADINLYCYTPRRMLNGFNVTDKSPLMIVLQALSECFWRSGGKCV